jgi:hypothetical protein
MQRMVEMTIDEDNKIHVAWLDAQHGEWNIYYSYSNDSGSTFSPNVRVTTTGTSLSYWRPGDYFTMRTGPNGRVHIVWTDGRGQDEDIYFAKQDIANPTITHVPVQIWSQNQALHLTLSVTDDDFVEWVTLHFRNPSASTWTSRRMEKIGDSTYQYAIPESELLSPTLEYYFVARDAAGRETRLPGSEPNAFLILITPFTPLFVGMIVGATFIIIGVIFVAYWYLRRTPNAPH